MIPVNESPPSCANQQYAPETETTPPSDEVYDQRNHTHGGLHPRPPISEENKKIYENMICTTLLHINPTPENYIVAAPAFKALVPEDVAAPFLVSWAWMMPRPDYTDFADVVPMSDRLAAEKVLLTLSEDDPSFTSFSMPDDPSLRKECTLTTWSGLCDPLKSSWPVMVCIATKMFPDEKYAALAKIEDLFKAVERVPCDFLNYGRSLWDRFCLSRNPYFNALFSKFADAKLAGSGHLIESYNECLSMSGRGLEIHPTCMVVRTGSRPMLYGWWREIGDEKDEPFAMHLDTLNVCTLRGNISHRDLFLTFFHMETDYHSLYATKMKLLTTIVSKIHNNIPLKFDLERDMWRVYDHRYGIWLLENQVAREGIGSVMNTPKMIAEHAISSILEHTVNTLGFIALLSQDPDEREYFFCELKDLKNGLRRLSQKDFNGKNLLSSFQYTPYMKSSFHDEPKHILSVANGLIDLRSGELITLTKRNEAEVMAYNLTRENHVRRVYYPSLDTSIIDEFFTRHMFRGVYDKPEEVLAIFRQFKGSVLTGEPPSKILILHGKEQNMKSILIPWDESVLGWDFTAKLNQDNLEVRNIKNNGTIYYAARNRSWCVSELTNPRKKINTFFIKRITSGGYGSVMARNKTLMRYPYTAKLQLYTRSVPEFDEDDFLSLHRRFILIHCKNRLYDDEYEKQSLLGIGIPEQFLRPMELRNQALSLSDEYFTWMVKGAGEWYREGKCHKVPACLQLTDPATEEPPLNRRLSSFVASYLKTVRSEQKLGLPVSWILYVFRAWCSRQGFDCHDNDNAVLRTLKRVMALFYIRNGKPARPSIKTRLGLAASDRCGLHRQRFSGSLYADVFWHDLVWENDDMLKASKTNWRSKD